MPCFITCLITGRKSCEIIIIEAKSVVLVFRTFLQLVFMWRVKRQNSSVFYSMLVWR